MKYLISPTNHKEIVINEFSKTVSVVAALASIFAAGATGWKLADSQKDVPLSPLDQKVMELEKNL